MTIQDLKGTIGSIGDAIIVTNSGGICFLANRAAKVLFQYKKKEFQGRNIGYFISTHKASSGKGYRKDSSAFSMTYVERAATLASMSIRLFTLYEVPKNESVPSRIWLKHSPYLFTLLNAKNLELLYVSPQSADVLGFEPGELLGTCYLDHVVAEDKLKIRKAFEDVVHNSEKTYNSLIRTRSVCKAGDVYVMEISLQCVRRNSETYLITAEKNITNHSLSEQRKMQLVNQRELVENQGALKVASLILHEVRNPLSAILNEVEVLQALAKTEQQKVQVAQAVVASEEANLALNDFLLLSQINNEKYPLLNVPFSLSQVMHTVLDSLKRLATAKKVSRDLKLDEALKTVRIGDPRKIHTVFDTLGQCCLQDMGENQCLSISVSTKSSSSNSHCLFLVSAKNEGLNELKASLYEQLNKPQGSLMDVWEKASSLQIAAQAMHLITVRAIIQVMKGSFHVVPDVHTKNVFYQIALSLELAEKGALPVAAPQKIDYVGCLQRYNLNVLCVEDNPMNLSIIANLWKKLGVASCDTAPTGAAAIELAKKRPYNVFALDYYMPQMTGEEVSRAIRNMEEKSGRRAIILLCTGIDLSEDPDLALRAKVDGILTKPINLNQLAEVTLNCLDKQI